MAADNMAMNVQPCPNPNCNNHCSPNAVMCVTCWARVPMAYQRQVLIRRNQANRAIRNPTLLMARLKAYRQACRVAIEFVSGRQVA